MILRCWMTFLLLHLMSKVSLQNPEKIDRVVGDTVTLPCLYENPQQITDVFWRHNTTRIVLDILNGIPFLNKQDKIFKNKTELLPDYVKGNYSLQLKNVEMDHAGIYTCFFSKSSQRNTVQLVVKEKPQEPNSNQEKQNASNLNQENATNSSMEAAQSQKILTFLIALLGLTPHLILV